MPAGGGATGASISGAHTRPQGGPGPSRAGAPEAWRGTFRRAVPRPQATLRLVCLPYAGGSAMIFDPWARQLPEHVEVVSVQLPGRGRLLLDAPYDDIGPLVDHLAGEIAALGGPRLALLGHSMGALVGFEVARALRARGALEPEALIVAGCTAPHLPRRVPRIHHLPPAAFWDAIAQLGGTPAEVLADAKLRELVEPALRADFAICESYEHRDGRPLDHPIFAYGGSEDPWIGPDEVLGWRRHTAAGFSAETIGGGHFFIHTAHDSMIASVRRALTQIETGGR